MGLRIILFTENFSASIVISYTVKIPHSATATEIPIIPMRNHIPILIIAINIHIGIVSFITLLIETCLCFLQQQRLLLLLSQAWLNDVEQDGKE
jgi:hypothetical protein